MVVVQEDEEEEEELFTVGLKMVQQGSEEAGGHPWKRHADTTR